MSGLDGGGSGDLGGGSVDSGAAPSAPAQPAAARTPQEQSDALDARVMAKRHAAEHGEDTVLAPPKGARGPDGKFLPGAGAEPKPKAEAKPAEPAKESDDHVKLKAEHDAISKERDSLKARDGEWTEVAEKALARIDSQKAYISQLEAALAEKGGSIDPTMLENVRLQERIRAIELAEERAAAGKESEAEQAKEAKRAELRAELTSSTKAALSKFPSLLKSGPDLKEYLQLVYRGGDPSTLAEVFAQRADKRAADAVRPVAPRTLTGSGAGTGGPKLRDPRDIADKWKAQLGANA